MTFTMRKDEKKKLKFIKYDNNLKSQGMLSKQNKMQ